MATALWLLIALPLTASTVLGIVGRRMPRWVVSAIGAGSVGSSFAVSVWLLVRWLQAPPAACATTDVLWFELEGAQAAIGLGLDPLALVMTLVVTGVGALILLYSIEFMEGDEGFSRFFAYMNLFVASMLILVLSENFLLLYLGWEGVGLCSYLLIGFWYREPQNGRAARKAFVVTRVGDAAMAIALFLVVSGLGTLDIRDAITRAATQWPVGSAMATATAALLLAGAVGKSAQLPLQTWLPDAMAGPTPVSALIHAATMVTAGVYLIARTHGLFELAPFVLNVVAAIGAVTLVLAGLSALAQRDIKRVLAYSTMSQIGYMFLALGVGAWSAAIFHLMTHAFFKALLFLSAGVVIHALGHEHDLHRMGGLRRELRGAFWAFLIGGSSLSGLPVLTAGFYSKDLILWHAWSSPAGGGWLWAAGAAGTLLTSLYIFRLVFLAFFGEVRTAVKHRPGLRMMLPLALLSVLSIAGGLVEIPPTLGGAPTFTRFLAAALPVTELDGSVTSEALLEVLAAGASFAGIGLAYMGFVRRRRPDAALPLVGGTVERLWRAGFGFDELYDLLLVRPVAWLARVNQADGIDALWNGVAALARAGHRALSSTQTGRLQSYATAIALGIVTLVALAVLT